MKFPRAILHNRAELVAVATAMLNGEMNLIEGVRKISSLRHVIGDPDSSIFMPIRAVDSETDHFPIGDVRQHWASERLKKMDSEMQSYLDDVKSDILAACREIVRAFS